MRKFISRLLILVGVLSLLFSSFLLWQRYTPTRLAFAVDTIVSNSNEDIVPMEISIKDIGIKLPIIPSKAEKNKWEATDRGLSYLASSPIPGNEGNSILYGHNWPNLLGNLYKIKPSQSITIKFNNGSEKTFIVEYISVVLPSQTHILKQTTDTRITLYTCTGFLDRERFVVTALLKS